MMRLMAIILFSALPFYALAQTLDATQRQRAALPFVIDQRNNALDGAALCQGDLGAAQNQLVAMKTELDTAKAEIERLTKKDAPQ